MADNDRLSITEAQLAMVFTAWEQSYHDRPEEYTDDKERLRIGVSPEAFGVSSAGYMFRRLREIQAQEETPKPKQMCTAEKDCCRFQEIEEGKT